MKGWAGLGWAGASHEPMAMFRVIWLRKQCEVHTVNQNGSLARQNLWWLAKWFVKKIPMLAQKGGGC